MNNVIGKILKFFKTAELEMKKSKLKPEEFDEKLNEFCEIASKDIAKMEEGTRLSFKKVMKE